MTGDDINPLSEKDIIKLRAFLLEHGNNPTKLALIKFFLRLQVEGDGMGISRRYVTSSRIAGQTNLPEEEVRSALRELSDHGITFYYESLSNNEICYLDTESHSRETREGFQVALRLTKENPDILDTFFDSLTNRKF